MGTVDLYQRSPLSLCDLVNRGVEREISFAAEGIRAVSVDGDLRSRLALSMS